MQFTDEKIEQVISGKIFELTHKKISSANEELVDSGILSSITMVELAVALEKEFNLSISFMEVSKENFKTINSIKTLLLKK